MQVVSISDSQEVEFADLSNHTATTVPKVNKLGSLVNNVG